MASGNKSSKIKKRVGRVGKKRALGALLIVAVVAFGSTVVNYYLFKIEVNLLQASIGILFISGFLAVLIEMRGVMDRKVSGIKSRIRKRRSKR